MLQTIPLSPEVGDGGGVAAVTLCLSQTVSKIPAKKGAGDLRELPGVPRRQESKRKNTTRR